MTVSLEHAARKALDVLRDLDECEMARLRGRADEAIMLLAQALLQRQPLTDERIDAITRERWGSQLLGVMVEAHREYACAVERAHYIGESL